MRLLLAACLILIACPKEKAAAPQASPSDAAEEGELFTDAERLAAVYTNGEADSLGGARSEVELDKVNLDERVRCEFPEPKATYGDDDRMPVECFGDRTVVWQSSGVGALIVGASSNATKTLRDAVKKETGRSVCSGEPFEREFVVAECTAFLVSPTELLTAGHCLRRRERGLSIGFDFDRKTGRFAEVAPVVSAEMVVGVDLGLLQIRRTAVGDRAVFPPKPRELATGERIYMLGCPLGVPFVLSGPAEVLAVPQSSGVDGRLSENWTALTNLDAFRGNSGSPVFGLRDGQLVGMLVGGRRDWEKKDNGRGRSCNTAAVYDAGAEEILVVDALVRSLEVGRRDAGAPANETEVESEPTKPVPTGP